MPDAIKNSGLLVGTIGLVILSILCVSCMHMLVNCAHTLGVRTRKPHMSYADVAEYAFSTSGPIPRRFSTTARLVLNLYSVKKWKYIPSQNIHTFINHSINISGSSLISFYVSHNSDFVVYTSYLWPKICNW